jgi:hypothetical protein
LLLLGNRHDCGAFTATRLHLFDFLCLAGIGLTLRTGFPTLMPY